MVACAAGNAPFLRQRKAPGLRGATRAIFALSRPENEKTKTPLYSSSSAHDGGFIKADHQPPPLCVLNTNPAAIEKSSSSGAASCPNSIAALSIIGGRATTTRKHPFCQQAPTEDCATPTKHTRVQESRVRRFNQVHATVGNFAQQ